jgi:threonine dehydrogenase-like Zn-dependent dehydrogenase
MLAMNYRGPQRVRVDHKPMPEILHPEDAIVRVTRSCICGSDLHLYNGSVPDTRVGMTFGHEFTGVVEQIGEGVEKLKVGDHILVPFNIACGKVCLLPARTVRQLPRIQPPGHRGGRHLRLFSYRGWLRRRAAPGALARLLGRPER